MLASRSLHLRQTPAHTAAFAPASASSSFQLSPPQSYSPRQQPVSTCSDRRASPLSPRASLQPSSSAPGRASGGMLGDGNIVMKIEAAAACDQTPHSSSCMDTDAGAATHDSLSSTSSQIGGSFSNMMITPIHSLCSQPAAIVISPSASDAPMGPLASDSHSAMSTSLSRMPSPMHYGPLSTHFTFSFSNHHFSSATSGALPPKARSRANSISGGGSSNNSMGGLRSGRSSPLMPNAHSLFALNSDGSTSGGLSGLGGGGGVKSEDSNAMRLDATSRASTGSDWANNQMEQSDNNLYTAFSVPFSSQVNHTATGTSCSSLGSPFFSPPLSSPANPTASFVFGLSHSNSSHQLSHLSPHFLQHPYSQLPSTSGSGIPSPASNVASLNGSGNLIGSEQAKFGGDAILQNKLQQLFLQQQHHQQLPSPLFSPLMSPLVSPHHHTNQLSQAFSSHSFPPASGAASSPFFTTAGPVFPPFDPNKPLTRSIAAGQASSSTSRMVPKSHGRIPKAANRPQSSDETSSDCEPSPVHNASSSSSSFSSPASARMPATKSHAPDHSSSSSQKESSRRSATSSSGDPYQCDECGKVFTQKGGLMNHLRIHRNERPFKCEVEGCGRAFAQKCNLTRHGRCHTGEKPFRCDECPRAFNRRWGLQIHKKMHQQGQPAGKAKPAATSAHSSSFATSSPLSSPPFRLSLDPHVPVVAKMIGSAQPISSGGLAGLVAMPHQLRSDAATSAFVARPMVFDAAVVSAAAAAASSAVSN